MTNGRVPFIEDVKEDVDLFILQYLSQQKFVQKLNALKILHSKSKQCPLELAAYADLMDEAKTLLAQNVDVTNRILALSKSVVEDNIEMLKLLLTYNPIGPLKS